MTAPRFEPIRIDFDPPIVSGNETLTHAVIFDAAHDYEDDEDE